MQEDKNGLGAPATGGWSKQQIEQFLAGEDLRYQKIDLPYGLATPGADRREVCDLAFGQNISGQTVLDIGSYLGYFCFEALRRGAAGATGLEVDPIKLRQAKTLANIMALDAEFIRADIETLKLDRKFDIILCLNVLHHLFDPVGTLHKLAEATRHKLVLEVASLNPRDARKLGLGMLTRALISKLPVMFVSQGIPSPKAHTSVQKFFMTPSAIRRILGCHRLLFARIDVYPSSHKGRFIVMATRRRIGTLVVVSGPTSSGKSTFLKKLREGQLPAPVAAQLPATGSWPMVGASQLLRGMAEDKPALPPEDLAGVVLHYDFLRPYASGIQDFRRDQALDLISCAENIIVVVLKPSRERLLRQLTDSELSGKKASPRFTLGIRPEKQKKRHKELFRLYGKDGWLAEWYERWENFVRASGARVIDVDDNYYEG
jgi:2-polyprenyl-3-methyl-5-hydroxy-6-metoxy-1,4-benzoquinol methylase